MATNNATDNIFTNPNPEVITHDSIEAGSGIAGGDTPRTFPRQLLSGTQRGILSITGEIIITNPSNSTQTIIIDGSSQSISIGSAISLDGLNDALKVTNSDGSIVGMGAIPDNPGDFGFYAQDAAGNLLYKIVGSTQYVYDITQTPHTNVIQTMRLPDGTYGWAVAAQGYNVSQGFS